MQPRRTSDERYQWREIRARRRVEQAVESLGERAIALGVDSIGGRLARPLLVEPDLRPRPWVVVLSGGITSKGLLSATSRERVVWAADLYRRGLGERLIVSGGPRRPGRPPSGPAMKRLAAELGVPEGLIETEGHSSRTAENAEEVAALLHARGSPSILLVTSPLHMRRATLCFAKHGVSVGAAPVPEASASGERPGRASLVSQALHEYIGLAYYRARGWI
jgi:uncharacterized SAM-binding protein YcdF (DUF218 family)